MTTFAARIAKTLAIGAAVIGLAAPAAAADYVFNLTGTIANGSYFTAGNSRFFDLTLDGAALDLPLTLAVGDTFTLNVTLDEFLTVPSSTAYGFFGVDFRTTPSSLADIPAGVTSSNTFTLNDGSMAGYTAGIACGNCVSGSMIYNAGTTFTVSSFTTVVTIENLEPLNPEDGDVVQLTSFELSYQATDLAPPVPEPGEWAMIGLGLAITGAVARRRARA